MFKSEKEVLGLAALRGARVGHRKGDRNGLVGEIRRSRVQVQLVRILNVYILTLRSE
jgi:hypothetical protein